MSNMAAKDVELALSKIHTKDFFITECKNGPTWFGEHSRMDAVAITKSWAHPCVKIYEVKVSRNDFLRDDKWPQYLEYCNKFYFACPNGLITTDDIQDARVGLIWVNDNGVCRTIKNVPSRAVDIPASFYQYILYSRIDSERTPFYSDREQYLRDYVGHKKSIKHLGYLVSSTLIKNLCELDDKFEEIKVSRGQFDKYLELMKYLQQNNQYSSPEWILKDFIEAKKIISNNQKINRIIALAKEIAIENEVK